jgi:hypothetical protein
MWQIRGRGIAKNHGHLRAFPSQIRTNSGLPKNCRALNPHLTKTCLNAVPRLCEMLPMNSADDRTGRRSKVPAPCTISNGGFGGDEVKPVRMQGE